MKDQLTVGATLLLEAIDAGLRALRDGSTPAASHREVIEGLARRRLVQVGYPRPMDAGIEDAIDALEYMNDRIGRMQSTIGNLERENQGMMAVVTAAQAWLACSSKGLGSHAEHDLEEAILAYRRSGSATQAAATPGSGSDLEGTSSMANAPPGNTRDA